MFTLACAPSRASMLSLAYFCFLFINVDHVEPLAPPPPPEDVMRSPGIGFAFSIGLIKLSTRDRCSCLLFISLGPEFYIMLLRSAVAPPIPLLIIFLSFPRPFTAVSLSLSSPVLSLALPSSRFAALCPELFADCPSRPLSNQSPQPRPRACPARAPAPPPSE